MSRQVNKDADIQCVDYRYDDGIRGRVDYDCCSTITTKESGYSGMPLIKMGGGYNMLRIRKLTENEVMRLMAFEKKDTDAMKEAGLSKSAIYHCAGDSIVVCCNIGLFGELLHTDYHKTIEDYVERLVSEVK